VYISFHKSCTSVSCTTNDIQSDMMCYVCDWRFDYRTTTLEWLKSLERLKVKVIQYLILRHVKEADWRTFCDKGIQNSYFLVLKRNRRNKISLSPKYFWLVDLKLSHTFWHFSKSERIIKGNYREKCCNDRHLSQSSVQLSSSLLLTESPVP